MIGPIALAVVALLALLGAAGILVRQRRAHVERQFTLYFSAGRFEDCLPWAERLARQGGADSQVRARRQQNLGAVLLRLDRWREALAAYERALAAQVAAGDPYAAVTRENLTWLELRAGALDRARLHAREIASHAPPEVQPRALTLEAAVLLRSGDAAKALALLLPLRAELEASRKPADAVALALLGLARLSSGEKDGESLLRLAASRLPAPRCRELAAALPELGTHLAGRIEARAPADQGPPGKKGP